MKIYEDGLEETLSLDGVVLTLGSFDGIHLGHRLILDTVVEMARNLTGTPTVLTMRPHPREFFSPENAPNLLTTEARKFAILESTGIEAICVLEFNATTAAISAPEFVRAILHERCRAKAIVVGHDCRFGRGAEGDYTLLVRLGPEYGFTAEEVPPFVVDGARVSSTLIRERVLQGDLSGVERLLGRKYSIVGEVVSGRGLGQKFGFPTANVQPHHSAIPAQGVYIAEALVTGRSLPAAVNIGIAPTIRQEDLAIEAHILDFDEDLRGKEIEIVFHDRVRPEKKFASVEELVAQIGRDVQTVREHFDDK